MVHRSALVLLAPSVHEALYDLRARHLRNLGRKMPSHVTILFPFRNPVDDATLAQLAEVSSGLAPFTATFSEVRRFGSSVVWLRPDPVEKFLEIIEAVAREFPDCSPYGGKHRGHTPHLSVGSRLPRAVTDALAAEVVPLLPLTERTDAMSLMFETGDGWRHDRSWPLGATNAMTVN